MSTAREDETLVTYRGFNERNDSLPSHTPGAKTYKFSNTLAITTLVLYTSSKLLGLLKTWNSAPTFLYHKIVTRAMVESGLWNRSGDAKEGKTWSGGEEVVARATATEVSS